MRSIHFPTRMGTAVRSSETGLGHSSAVGREETPAREAELGRERWGARKVALVGVGLFGLAWLLGGIGQTQGLLALVPYAEMSLGLGFVLAFFGAVIAGTPLREVVPIGVVFGIGHFYKGQDHGTHILSGWGFGLEHTPHILLGLVLIGVATAVATFLAFYHTKGSTQSKTSSV